ncbi:hypothetical protein FRC05_002358 [Tulasnella sp. 425]|nr:hypothetical protein FRC05_002358 [Tulasnella sp. 425]
MSPSPPPFGQAVTYRATIRDEDVAVVKLASGAPIGGMMELKMAQIVHFNHFGLPPVSSIANDQPIASRSNKDIVIDAADEQTFLRSTFSVDAEPPPPGTLSVVDTSAPGGEPRLFRAAPNSHIFAHTPTPNDHILSIGGEGFVIYRSQYRSIGIYGPLKRESQAPSRLGMLSCRPESYQPQHAKLLGLQDLALSKARDTEELRRCSAFELALVTMPKPKCSN